MDSVFEFKTAKQAIKFQKEMHKRFILVEFVGDCSVRIYNYENIKAEHKATVMNTAKSVYNKIMN